MATRMACGDLHSYKVVCIGAVNNGHKIWHVVTSTMATRMACGDLHSIQGGLHRCSQPFVY